MPGACCVAAQKFQVWRQKNAARRQGPSPGAKRLRRPLPSGRGNRRSSLAIIQPVSDQWDEPDDRNFAQRGTGYFNWRFPVYSRSPACAWLITTAAAQKSYAAEKMPPGPEVPRR